jgi:type II secretory pathway component HofQ
MDAKDFKTEIRNLKEWLKGKTISITLMTPNGGRKYTFRTLKGFGAAVLEFEAMGAAFGFMNVSNPYIQKPTKDFNELMEKVGLGVWTGVEFLATTIK